MGTVDKKLKRLIENSPLFTDTGTGDGQGGINLDKLTPKQAITLARQGRALASGASSSAKVGANMGNRKLIEEAAMRRAAMPDSIVKNVQRDKQFRADERTRGGNKLSALAISQNNLSQKRFQGEEFVALEGWQPPETSSSLADAPVAPAAGMVPSELMRAAPHLSQVSKLAGLGKQGAKFGGSPSVEALGGFAGTTTGQHGPYISGIMEATGKTAEQASEMAPWATGEAPNGMTQAQMVANGPPMSDLSIMAAENTARTGGQIGGADIAGLRGMETKLGLSGGTAAAGGFAGGIMPAQLVSGALPGGAGTMSTATAAGLGTSALGYILPGIGFGLQAYNILKQGGVFGGKGNPSGISPREILMAKEKGEDTYVAHLAQGDLKLDLNDEQVMDAVRNAYVTETSTQRNMNESNARGMKGPDSIGSAKPIDIKFTPESTSGKSIAEINAMVGAVRSVAKKDRDLKRDYVSKHGYQPLSKDWKETAIERERRGLPDLSDPSMH